MKRTLLVFLLVNLILSACAPASAPISTPAPSATPLPTATTAPTNTAVPTATPTPIPSIQVGDLTVPDPRVTNPELFDLTKPEAPIPQFVNALKNAGIEVSAEQIAQVITFVSTKQDGTPLVDKDGNPYVVAIYNLDPSLFPEKYRDLAGPIHLMIAEKGEKWWGWSKNLFKEQKNYTGISIGPMLTGWFVRDPNYMGEKYMSIPKQFTIFVSPDILMKTGIENGRYDLRPDPTRFDFTIPDYALRYAEQNNLKIQFFHVFWGDENTIPLWIKNINSQDELWRVIDYHIENLLSRYKNKVDTYSLLNEYFGNPFNNDPGLKFWKQKANSLGIEDIDFVTHLFRKAKEIDPSARLLFNEYGMEIPGIATYSNDKSQKIFNLLKEAKEKNSPIDVVGFQMHLYAKDFLGKSFEKNMEAFRNQIKKYKSLGLEVDITELDIRLNEGLSNLPENEHLLLQAKIYTNIIKIAKEEGITHITIWGISDRDSWLENPSIGGPDANPLLFDDRDNPKIVYYEILSELFK